MFFRVHGVDVLVMGKVAFLWVCWCFLHSLLISPFFVRHMRSLLGKRFVCYRLFFNGISLTTLVAVVVYQFSQKQVIVFDWSGWWRVVQLGLILYGSYMFFIGLKRYDMSFFLGIRQLKSGYADLLSESVPFTADCKGGVRHPWYSGGIALVVGIGSVTDVSLAAKIVVAVYFVIGAFLEERKLIREIGDPYVEYCKKTPMLIPRFFWL